MAGLPRTWPVQSPRAKFSPAFSLFITPHRLMARFQRPNDFWGEYRGRLDGRRARLRIGDTKADAPFPLFLITLIDEDRNATFRAQVPQRSAPEGHRHILRDFTLDEVGGSGEKDIALLLLHTWDTDHVTMVTRWRGREFGSYFVRER